MPGFKFKVEVVTLTTATTAYAASTSYLPCGTMIQPAAGNGGTVYIGASDVAAAKGYIVSSTVPLRLGDVRLSGSHEDFYGPSIFFTGSQNGDKVVLLIPCRDDTRV